MIGDGRRSLVVLAGNIAHGLNNASSALRASEMFLQDVPVSEASDLASGAIQSALRDIGEMSAVLELLSMEGSISENREWAGGVPLTQAGLEDIFQELMQQGYAMSLQMENQHLGMELRVNPHLLRAVLVCACAGLRRAIPADCDIEVTSCWLEAGLASLHGLEINLLGRRKASESFHSRLGSMFFEVISQSAARLQMAGLEVVIMDGGGVRCRIAAGSIERCSPVHESLQQN